MKIRERGNVFYPSSGLKVGRAEFVFLGQGGAEYSFQVPKVPGLSVSHDLTKEERIYIKDLVKKAKDQTTRSPNLDYKVVGPPWQPTIKSYKKREAK